MADERIVATYLIETPYPPQAAAEAMARQTTGTFTPVPGETAEVQRWFQPRIERIEELETVDRPTLPGSRLPSGTKGPPQYTRAEVVLSFPLDNVGTNLPVMLSMVRGNLFELPQVSGLRLMDLDLPEAFARVSAAAVRCGRHAAADGRAGPADPRHDHQAKHRAISLADG